MTEATVEIRDETIPTQIERVLLRAEVIARARRRDFLAGIALGVAERQALYDSLEAWRRSDSLMGRLDDPMTYCDIPIYASDRPGITLFFQRRHGWLARKLAAERKDEEKSNS